MNRRSFREKIEKSPLLLDGAMGTLLHQHGFAIDQCFDCITLDDPGLVAAIHRGYIQAGADIIETNTFGANHFKLAHHGLADQVTRINQAAVALARQVIRELKSQVLLAGSVGPLGVRLAPLGRVSSADALEAFKEQIAALLSSPEDKTSIQGVDLIILETISDLKEMEVAARAARQVAPDMALIGMMTFTRDDRTLIGDTATKAAIKLSELDLDAIGINCSSGPQQVLRLISVIREYNEQIPLIASPNAGWPNQVEGGRVMYPATPSYFGDYATAFIEAGASIVGGCCGTTFEHIASMRQSLDSVKTGTRISGRIQGPAINQESFPVEIEKSKLCLALENNSFITTVELSPPRGIGTKRLLTGARMLEAAGAGFFDITDSPLARMRMSAWAAAHMLQRETGIETILHFPTRGRNLLRIQGDLLAAHALGIRNLFVVMGDPTQIGDYPEAMDDYDIVPSGLIRLIKERLNTGYDKAGRSIDEPTQFTVGCALNLEPLDFERELRLLKRKIRSGADFAITQPVFDSQEATKFITICREVLGDSMIPIVAGIQPLYSSNNAEFLHNEVPGIQIPGTIRDRMKGAIDQSREGVTIAQETFQTLRSHVNGIYLIPVFERYDLVADVLDIVSLDL